MALGRPSASESTPAGLHSATGFTGSVSDVFKRAWESWHTQQCRSVGIGFRFIMMRSDHHDPLAAGAARYGSMS